MLKTMKTGGISHEFWPFFVYFGLHPFTFSHLFCFMASLGEDSLSKWSIIWMQPCAACHLMLLDVAKEFNHWNYGISKSNWIQNSSPTKKNTKSFTRKHLCNMKRSKTTRKQASNPSFHPYYHPEKPTKTYPNAKSTHYHQKKKKLSKMMCGSHPATSSSCFCFLFFWGTRFV